MQQLLHTETGVRLHDRQREIPVKKIFRLVKFLFIGLALLAAVLLFNTMRYTPETISETAQVSVNVDIAKASTNLGKAIGFKTISFNTDTAPDADQFNAFIQWLKNAYPNVKSQMQIETIGPYSQVYIWEGSDPDLKPILLTAHFDVVPVPDNTLGDWKHTPFSGAIVDDHIWARGALDDKVSVIGMLEAADLLIASGYKPKRSIYFAFGHDEELGGQKGANAIVSHFKGKNIQFAWSLDEGSAVLDNIIEGLPYPLASINVAEKGYMTLNLMAKGTPGHSSMPPSETAIGRLSRAIVQLEKNQVAGGLTGVSEDFFDAMGRHFSFEKRLIFANRWLFGPFLENLLSQTNTTNAMLRTTTAPTVINGGIKDNVLPGEAVAKINFRIHPRDTSDSVIEHVKTIIDDDMVQVSPQGKPNNASPVSSHDSEGYKVLEQTFSAVFGKIITVPGLTIAATDSVHYSKISDDSYRILPIKLTSDSLKGIHGPNESISLGNFENSIVFYHELMKHAGG